MISRPLNLLRQLPEKCDLLIVLLPEGFNRPAKDALSAWRPALRTEDLTTKAGKHLQLCRVPAVAARRVVLVGPG